MPGLKLLLVTNLFPPDVLGGYEILCAQVAHELHARGHDIVVITSAHGATADRAPPRLAGVGSESTAGTQVDAQGDAAAFAIHRELEVYIPFDRPGALARRARFMVSRRNRRRTAALIEAERPDVIFVWSQLRLGLGAAIAAESSGRPVAYSENDEHLAGYLPVPFAGNLRAVAGALLDRTALRSATLRSLRLAHVTCISRCTRDALVAKGVPIAHAEVIYQGIPVRQFPVKDVPGAIGRPLDLLYVGQLHRYKGVHTAIAAAHALAAEADVGGVTFSIIGSGPPEYELELEGLAANGPARVHLLGSVAHDQLPARYRAADVFVFPSTWREPFGLTHLEAMASGTPVVSTIVGGQGEFLRDGENALVFPPGDAARLAAQLHRLLVEPRLAVRLASAARVEVATHFSLDRYVSDLEAFLSRAPGRTARSSRTDEESCAARSPRSAHERDPSPEGRVGRSSRGAHERDP